MMKLSFSASILFFLLFCLACSDGNVMEQRLKSGYLPRSTGRIDEVITVIEPELWRGQVGNTLRETLMQDYLVLPQSEPLFDLHQVPGKSLLDLLKRNSTLLVIGLPDDETATANLLQKQINIIQSQGNKVPSLFSRKNVWAEPQKVVYLQANTEEKLIEAIRKQEKNLIRELREVGNRKARNNAYVPGISEGLTQIMTDKFKLNFRVPAHFIEIINADNYMWIRHDDNATEALVNVMVYSDPYVPNQPRKITTDYIIEMRNKIAKNVESQVEGAYMVSDDKYMSFEHDFAQIGGHQAWRTRGLWRMEGDFMGGPFVTFCFDDPKNNRTVLIDGFVYAPKTDKRPYMRKLEMMLRGVQTL